MPPTQSRENRDQVPALARAIRIVDLLADARGVAVPMSDIARAIGAAKSSTSYLCAALEDARIIRRVETGYTLGPRTAEFGGAYIDGFNEVREFYRFCSTAPLLSQEVAQIAMLDGTDVVYLARHEGTAPLRLTANIGDRLPAAPTAVGNALLAALPPEEIAVRFGTPGALPRRTEQSVASVVELLRKLAEVRERGYAVDENEVHPGISGIAVRIPPRTTAAPALAIGCSFITEGGRRGVARSHRGRAAPAAAPPDESHAALPRLSRAAARTRPRRSPGGGVVVLALCLR
ncbi:IclR family transcriptional regulator [Agromyces archimandritae]|uniref:IclR family transcriptional regulator n=1 Tax=Agromyces archimandritae TaxID=2781962 RepID=A0A975FQB4_9MICO|nr:IclR family transcriptional regulator [Agromyces archimandritae]QTX05867.1 IclR family transcriptional regulator [Agromyces archimandritae]